MRWNETIVFRIRIEGLAFATFGERQKSVRYGHRNYRDHQTRTLPLSHLKRETELYFFFRSSIHLAP